MVRNYKAVIVRGLPVEKPVALCGGIGHNQGVIQAVREVFGLTEAELILPEKFPYAGAAGAAEAAMETATCSMGGTAGQFMRRGAGRWGSAVPSAGAARTSRYTSVCPRGHRYHPAGWVCPGD